MIDDVTTDQPVTESVTDRIASKFGFPASEQADAESALGSAESEFADIDWDGAKYQIPTKLKDAFMKNEDYTRKTQELSEQRRALEHMRELGQNGMLESNFNQSVSAETQQLAVIDAYLSQAAKVDWTSMSTDQMLRHKVEVDNIKEQRQFLKSSIETKRAQFQAQVQGRIKEMRGKSREIAAKSIQGFSEETEAAMRKHAASEGLSDAEVDNVLLDPRSFKILYKAMQFDKIQSGAKPSNEKLGKVLRPGAASERMPADTVNKLNFAKQMKSAQTSSQKAGLIEDRLANMFTKR